MSADAPEKLRPGVQCEASLSTDTALKVAEQLYGFRVSEIKKFDGYEDRNYFLAVTAAEGNKHVPEVKPEGYVLKVINNISSKKPAFFDGQFEMMRHLNGNGLRTNTIVLQTTGYSKCHVTLHPDGTFTVCEGGEHLVYVLEYVAGSLLRGLPCTPHLMFSVGEYLGRFRKALQTFHHDGFKQAASIWHMEDIADTRDYLSTITDDKRRQLFLDIIDAVEREILQSRINFRQGYIHTDFNESNLIVRPSPTTPGEYEPSGIIDYGESYHGHIIFEVGNCLAYMMIETEFLPPLECAGHVLAGFLEHVDLLPEERKVLRLCAVGRMAQSIALGIYTHATQEEQNDYTLLTANKGSHLMKTLWETPQEEFDRVWTEVLGSYGKQWITEKT